MFVGGDSARKDEGVGLSIGGEKSATVLISSRLRRSVHLTDLIMIDLAAMLRLTEIHYFYF